ncbi:LysR family transcriptional regulator [Thermohalobaculum sediminis]|uniref:LysR family transcriptional regulator n=1 Tax=Thermohalobaculum sediminis TaxID=2939436 RepID=UPI003873B9F2
MPALSLAHLQMLVAIREARTLSAAAERLGLTQSALTHRLREAERRLGVILFAKVGRQLRPSAAAEILTETAEHVIDRIELAERAAAASSQGVRHIVRLAVCDYNAYHWLPGFLAVFTVQHPDIEIEIEPGTMASTLRQLAEGRLDIALVPAARDASPADAIALFDDDLAAIVWPGHRFDGRASVRAADFDAETYLTYSLEARAGFESERLWSADGTMPVRKRNLGSVDAVCELIKARAGVSILSRWGVTRELAAGSLVATPLAGQGIPIRWSARIASGLAADAPVRRVAEAMPAWFERASS